MNSLPTGRWVVIRDSSIFGQVVSYEGIDGDGNHRYVIRHHCRCMAESQQKVYNRQNFFLMSDGEAGCEIAQHKCRVFKNQVTIE